MSYKYKIEKIKLKSGIEIVPGRINVFVGANNCGKTQFLKDMLSILTTPNDSTIVVERVDIPTPKSWEEMAEAYGMKIQNKHGTQELKHILPTFDGEPFGSSGNNLTNALNLWLKNDYKAFKQYTGPGLVTFLNTDNRLRLALSCNENGPLNKRGAKNVLEALYLSGKNVEIKLKTIIKKIFDVDICLSPYNIGSLEIKVGQDLGAMPLSSQDAYSYLESFPNLDIQGDGLRSIVGIISAIVAVKRPVILIDEPEAFLHPPQALQLGQIISELVDDNTQVFIATHSADFLRGLISVVQDSKIIRLERSKEDVTTANLLEPDILKQIVTDPLLSSARVLEGMFYRGVVATEGDADCIFYQRLFQKIGANDEIHFVNAHNKQTLKKVISPYQKLGVKYAMIADADVIRDKHEFNAILSILNNTELKGKILQERDELFKVFDDRDKSIILNELKQKTQELIDRVDADPQTIESKLYEFRQALKRLYKESDELANFKDSGRESLSAEFKTVFDSLYENCASIGLFIVPVGELESWLTDYGVGKQSNKSKWIISALENLPDVSDESKAIWRFLKKLQEFLSK